ncbi:MAG: hypothetical protein AAF602_08290, partial [Myxococcota bacterium]
MAHVGLGRTEPDAGEAIAERIPHRADLGDVAHRRSRAVGLDVVGIGRIEARVLPGVDHDRGLTRAHGCHRAIAAAVVVERDALDDRVDAVAVALRVLEPLEQEGARALALDEPVGPCVEGQAAPLLAHRPDARERDVVLGGDLEVAAAGQRRVDGAPAELGDRVVDRDERRGARGVDGVGGPLEVELLGHCGRGHVR